MATYDLASRYLWPDEDPAPGPDRWSVVGPVHAMVSVRDFLRTDDGTFWIRGTHAGDSGELVPDNRRNVARLTPGGSAWEYFRLGQYLEDLTTDGDNVYASFIEPSLSVDENGDPWLLDRLRITQYSSGIWQSIGVINPVTGGGFSMGWPPPQFGGAVDPAVGVTVRASRTQRGVVHVIAGEHGHTNGSGTYDLRRRFVFATFGAFQNFVVISDQRVGHDPPNSPNNPNYIPDAFSVAPADIAVHNGVPHLIWANWLAPTPDTSTWPTIEGHVIKIYQPYTGTQVTSFSYLDYDPEYAAAIAALIAANAGFFYWLNAFAVSDPMTDPFSGESVRTFTGALAMRIHLLPGDLSGPFSYVNDDPDAYRFASGQQDGGVAAVADPLKKQWWVVYTREPHPFLQLPSSEVSVYMTPCPGSTQDPSLAETGWRSADPRPWRSPDDRFSFTSLSDDAHFLFDADEDAFYLPGTRYIKDDSVFGGGEFFGVPVVIRLPICRDCGICPGGCCQVICANLAAGPAAPEIYGDIGVSLTTAGGAVDFSFELVQWELYWGSHGNEDVEVDYRYAPIEDISTAGWETAINGALQELPVSATPTDTGEWALEARSRDVCTGEVSPTARAAFHVILTSADADRGPLEPAPTAPDTVDAQVSSTPRIVTQR